MLLFVLKVYDFNLFIFKFLIFQKIIIYLITCGLILLQQVGNKTECALLGFVLDLGKSYQAIRDEMTEENFRKVYTFNSARKSMSTVVPREGGGYRIYTKGASEMVMKRCSFIYGKDGRLENFTRAMQDRLVREVIEPMACDGLRTISIAYRDFVPDKAEINQVRLYFKLFDNVCFKV